MKLEKYLENKNKTEFGRLCGYKHETAIFRLLNGTRRPSRKMAVKIVELTKGKVTLKDLLL